MIAHGMHQIYSNEWWLWVSPAVALALLVLSINMVSEAAHAVARQGGSAS